MKIENIITCILPCALNQHKKFYNAFLGYGHVFPQTDGGRIFCMIYALVGIPLFLLMIADIGKFVMEAIKELLKKARLLLLSRFSPRSCSVKSDIERQSSSNPQNEKEYNFGPSLLLITFAVYLLLGTILCPVWEKWSFLESMYFW